MAVTVAEIVSRIALGLGNLSAEYIDLEEIYNAAVQQLNIHTAWAEIGTNNSIRSVSAEFSPSAVTHDITALIGKGTPLWIEQFLSSEVGGVNNWLPLRVVNLADLNDFYNIGTQACAFYAEDSATPGTDLTQYVKFAYLPESALRIYYTRDLVRLTFADKSPLTDEVAELTVLKAQNTCIARIKLKVAMNMPRNEQSRLDLQPLMMAFDSLYASNMMNIQPLQRLWEVQAFREKASQRGFNKPTPKSSALYGG